MANWTAEIGRFQVRLGIEPICQRTASDDTLSFKQFTSALKGSPPMAERTKHQQKIIKNYYENYDAIALQRLGEQVTDLYLAEGKAREKLWQQITKLLEKLKIPASRIDHLVKTDDPALLAKLLEELLAKT
jgi:hypothetical protein